jgi:hypothetical protein
MVSIFVWPQCGHVNVDSNTALAMIFSVRFETVAVDEVLNVAHRGFMRFACMLDDQGLAGASVRDDRDSCFPLLFDQLPDELSVRTNSPRFLPR